MECSEENLHVDTRAKRDKLLTVKRVGAVY